MTSLSIRGATVLRDRRLAVEDASFTAPAGAVTAVLGITGSGKTTLLTAIAGLIRLERGAILRGETDVTALPPRRRDVAMLAPGSTLPPAATVRAALSRLAGRRAVADCDALIEQLGLAAIADRDPDALTHGQALLAMTAARLARPGAAVLVDEAGCGLEPDGMQRLQAVLRYHAQAGRTVLFATRSPDMAWSADHLVLLSQGRVLQAGTPASLYAEPRDVACALLTGTASILSGQVRELRPGGFAWSAGGARYVQASGAEVARPTLGNPVTLCLRPSQLHLLPPGAPADNAVEAVVAGVRHLGGNSLVAVNTRVGQMEVSCTEVVSVGQQVCVAWAASAGFVLS